MKTFGKILKTVLRIVEEIFPFAHYFIYSRQLEQEVKSSDILKDKKLEYYRLLSEKQLRKRLKEEHQRPLVMDQKTFRLTLSLSFEFTVLSSAAALLHEAELHGTVQTALTIIILVGLVYVLVAGVIALGAARTHPRYGVGTKLRLQLRLQQNDAQEILAKDLARQEITNHLRHYRNETVYIALRNVFFLIVVGAIVFAATLLWH